MRSMTMALLLGALLLGAWGASAAHAQDAPDRLRLGGHLALAFGGDADTQIGDASGSNSLDPTIGGGARVEMAIHDYVSVGGMFEVLTFEQDAVGAEREAVFDFDGIVRARYAIELSAGSLWIEPYLALPFGLTLAVLDDPDGSGDEVWPGFNIGALAGAYLVTNANVAFFLEMGWRHHQVFNEASAFGFDVDLKVVTNQFAVQLGATFIL